MNDSDRLNAIGRRRHGEYWQSKLAREIGVSGSSMRRWLSGDPVPEGVWLDLACLERESRVWPLDEWIIGADAEDKREYIIHTRSPRFIARIAHSDDDANTVTGTTYRCKSGETLCEVAWLDPVPISTPEVLDLFNRAEKVIYIYTTG